MDATAVPELVIHETTGVLVGAVSHERWLDHECVTHDRPHVHELTNAILRVLCDRAFHAHLSQEAREHTAGLSWANMVGRYLELLAD